MNRFAIILLATAVSLPASAQQPVTTTNAPQAQDASKGIVSGGKDRIGLTATQRQMIAWSIAGLADLQRVPSGFQPSPERRCPMD